MKRLAVLLVWGIAAAGVLVAQGPPRIVPFSGMLTDANGKPQSGTFAVAFNLYDQQSGGTPLWVEIQTVEADSAGRYQVQLGASTDGGLPVDLFSTGQARFLGVQPQGEGERPRIQLLAVPYAIAASEAATLAGRGPADFVLNERLAQAVREQLGGNPGANRASAGDSPITSATTNRLVKYNDMLGTQGDSSFVDLAGKLGVGTSNPNYPVQVHAAGGHSLLQFTNSTTGAGAGDGSYFGVLNGETLFRVYNFENGNIEFYTNNQRRMTVRNDGNVGIGTQNPNYLLQAHSTGGHSLLQFTNSTTGAGAGDGSYFGILNGDPTFRVYNFENAGIDFFTNNLRRVTVAANGNVGVGTNAPTTPLHVMGDIRAQGAGAGFIFGDGTKQTTAATGGGGGGGAVRVVDNNSTDVGQLFSVGNALRFVAAAQNNYLLLPFTMTGGISTAYAGSFHIIYYTTTNCTGQAYNRSNASPGLLFFFNNPAQGLAAVPPVQARTFHSAKQINQFGTEDPCFMDINSPTGEFYDISSVVLYPFPMSNLPAFTAPFALQ